MPEASGARRMLVELRKNGMKARQKTRLKKTTDSHHGGPVAPNILDQNFATDAPNEKWGVMRDACFQHDISYVWTAGGGCIWRSSLIYSRAESSAGP